MALDIGPTNPLHIARLYGAPAARPAAAQASATTPAPAQRPAAVGSIIAARVPGPVRFDPPALPGRRSSAGPGPALALARAAQGQAPDASQAPQPIPFYTNPTARNTAETALLIGRRLDTQG